MLFRLQLCIFAASLASGCSSAVSPQNGGKGNPASPEDDASSQAPSTAQADSPATIEEPSSEEDSSLPLSEKSSKSVPMVEIIREDSPYSYCTFYGQVQKDDDGLYANYVEHSFDGEKQSSIMRFKDVRFELACTALFGDSNYGIPDNGNDTWFFEVGISYKPILKVFFTDENTEHHYCAFLYQNKFEYALAPAELFTVDGQYIIPNSEGKASICSEFLGEKVTKEIELKNDVYDYEGPHELTVIDRAAVPPLGSIVQFIPEEAVFHYGDRFVLTWPLSEDASRPEAFVNHVLYSGWPTDEDYEAAGTKAGKTGGGAAGNLPPFDCTIESAYYTCFEAP